MGSVFAGIRAVDQSGGKTAGLKTVSKEMQTWRKEYTGSNAPPPAAPTPRPKSVRPAAVPKGPPRKELKMGKWFIENQTDVVTVDVDRSQGVMIIGCIGATILLNGKAKTIAVDACKKTKVVFDDAVSSVELVNCERIQIQIKGTCPVVAIDKTDGCLTYLSESSLGAQFMCSKSSEMNVAYPKPGCSDDFSETPIPEQFVHRLVKETGRMSSDVSDLYCH